MYCTLVLFLVGLLLPGTFAVKCLDCVGKDCMGNFCKGDYCVLTQYAPRWGESKWGEPQVVKGCMSGTMVRQDIRDHCETVDLDGQEVFTCFCKSKDYCNGPRRVAELKTDPVPLVSCVCKGKHCEGRSCLGELCTYVKNLVTGETEQGCINASVPVVERRSAGACMVPPITGAMHHTLARSAEDLLFELVGTKTASRNISCEGEYCFKSKIESKIGNMAMYRTMGCASFIDGAELPEEFDPIGCAKFESEDVSVESCFTTTDRKAMQRARANQERPNRRKGDKNQKMEITYDEGDYPEDDDEEEEEKPKAAERQPNKKKPSKVRQREETEEDSEEESKEDYPKEDEEEEAQEEKQEARGKTQKEEKEPEKGTTKHYIFEAATEPPIPDDSNVTLVAVFVLIMLLIVASGAVWNGAVWKFELHKKLFRSNYDTVAGG
uniref:Activin_recp domain-containing protein n=1 Tax=Steinernema glaseri TaxID=37863 RepID=A0A1I7YYA0_9BILA